MAINNILTIKEAIVCEGRDDTINILRAIDCMTIETHGFGIRKETWDLIEKAYNGKGIIVFTDPDFSGEEIRRKILLRFPNAKQAFLTVDEATKNGDVGVENASPEAIAEAIKKARAVSEGAQTEFTESDLIANGLSGLSDSKERRMRVGKTLGIGYSNAKTFLKKLNKFDISREDFEKAVSESKE